MTAPLEGAKGGGSQSHTPVEATDSLHSVAYAQILDLVSEGPIRGFVHDDGAAGFLRDVYFDQTPVANADGSLNFKNVKIDSRSGTQDQLMMTGFADVESETAVNYNLLSTAPWTQSITNLDDDAIRITLSVPSLQKSDTTTGDIQGYSISYAIDVQTDGGSFYQVLASSFTGKTTSKYQRAHRIDLPPATSGWTVRVRRLTAEAHLATVQDTTTVDSYAEIVDAKLRYPNSAYVGSVIDSSQFSSIPARAFDLYGRIISVPSNYNPTTRAYTGSWDGTFVQAWTDNPAWIFYDLATNSRYGLGQYVSAALVNKWNLYNIAQYCDGLVADGFGGTEPRMTCSLFLQTQEDAFKVLSDLATVFRGISYWAGGAIQPVADMPSDPVYPYTAANVIGGKFTYQGSSAKTRYTVALVSWNDPADFGKAKVHYVPDQTGIARYGVQTVNVTAVGCTSVGQAQRAGLWTLYTSRLETDVVTFKVGLDGTIAAPGQIIAISDPARAGSRQAGRIHAATATAVTLDKAPTVSVGDTLTCTLPTGVTESHAVTGASGNDVTVAAPGFSQVPLPEAVWLIETASLSADLRRVVSVTEDGTGPDLSFMISAVQHNASKFGAIDAGLPINVPKVSTIPPSAQPPITGLALEAFPVANQVLTNTLLIISWNSAAGAVYYDVKWRKDNGSWQPLGRQSGLSVDVTHASPGAYQAMVTAVNASGISSIAVVSSPYTVADQTTPSTAVATLRTEVTTAQSSADAANTQLADIASDNILSPAEKPTVIRDYSVITSEQAGIDGQAASFLGAGSSQQADYDNAITALTAYLGGLTSPTAWNDKTGNTTIVGATFRDNFNTVYTTRQTLLNAIYAAAKSKADAAQSTANTANSLATQVPIINGGFDATPYGTGWTMDSQWSIKSDGAGPGVGLGYAQFTPNGSNGAIYNGGRVGVVLGQTYKAQGLIRGSGTPNGNAYVRIRWLDATGAQIAFKNGNTVTGNTTAGSYAVDQAPAGAYYAATSIEVDSCTTGTYQLDNVVATLMPAHLGEVPDTTGRYAVVNGASLNAVSSIDGGNRALIDFSQGGHFNKQLDNIGDGSTYYRMPAANMDGSRRALIDFTQAGHVSKNLDNIGDGTTYGRALGSRLNAGNPLIDFAAGYHLNKNVDNVADGSSYFRTAQAGQSENVDNASFEASTALPPPGWFGTGALSYVTSYAYSGTQSLQLFATAQYQYVKSTRIYRCVPGEVWTISSAILCGSGETWGFGFDLLGGSGGLPGITPIADGAWHINTFANYTIPAGITGFRIVLYSNNATGSHTVVLDEVKLFRVRSIDSEIQDGSTYGRTVQSRLSSGVPFIDFAAGIHLNKNIDNVADGPTYGRPLLSRLSSGNPLIDFSAGYHLNKNVDNVADGTTYARIKGTELSSGVHKLGVAGSGTVLGNQLNAPNSLTLNYGASRTATAVTATSAGVVSINAFTFKMGGAAVPYNAVSNAVTGLTVGVTYQIYCHDAGGTGGTKTWYAVAGTQTDALSISDNVVIAGQVTIPSSGSSGGGGTGCPVVGAWVIRRTIDGPAWAQAGDVVVGDELLLTSGQWGRVSHSRKVLQPCVQVRDENGFTLSCSRSAPLGRTDGSQVLAPDAEGELIESRTGIVKGSSRVADVRDIGEEWVQHITCENDFFWVGDQTDRLFSHHNLKP